MHLCTCQKNLDQRSSELTLWVNNVDSSFNNLVQSNPDLSLTRNASTEGWSTVYREQKTGGLWSLEEQGFHINYLKMKAVFAGFEIFIQHLS